MDSDEIKVRFKFKDQSKVYRGIMTRNQFENMSTLPIIELCEIVSELGKQLSTDKELELKKRLTEAFKNDTSHVRNLCYD